MADNVAISASDGTVPTVATDQVAGTLEHVQLFKLAYAADGSRVLVPADADGLLVKVQGLVSDARESYVDGTVKPLSLTSDGRLRVSSSPADTHYDFYPDVVLTCDVEDGDVIGHIPSPWS